MPPNGDYLHPAKAEAGPEGKTACQHLKVGSRVSWDFAPTSILVSCADCGCEAIAPVDWDDREWGED